MINWDEFEHIHVIKKLKQILNSWWNIEVVFTDESGELRGFEQSKNQFKNSSYSQLFNKEPGQQSFKNIVAGSLQEIRASGQRYTIKKWDYSGLDLGIFPIFIENDCVGTVIAFGFLTGDGYATRLTEVKQNFTKLGMGFDQVEKTVQKIKYLDNSERQHFSEICDLVSQEIVTLHLEISTREDRIKELNSELGNRYKYDNMIGKSKSMQSLYALLDKIKSADSTVLIQGENGTGKELIAKSIHYNSARKDKPFIVQNCSAFNDNLLESELFGHVKGSFTGALKDKKGLFEMADKGTFFLDEIGDTSPQMQVKLLRAIQEGTFTPVGSTEAKKVDVRILAATNKNLREMVENGTFREDLYYRLNVINIRVPPLRERKEDVPILVDYFLQKISDSSASPRKSLVKRALEKLLDYAWPGNVRELQNEIERLVVLSGDEMKLQAELLSPKILDSGDKVKVQGARLHGKLKDALEDLERDMIREGLRRTGWNKSKLAKELGISRAGLIMKVEKYGLDKRKLAR